MKGFFILGLLVGAQAYGQNTAKDSLKETVIPSIHFTRSLPVTKEIIDVSKDLDYKNLGQDLPILLKNQTSVISTSDAGNGVGYTGFRIRGVGGTSINVMMNGVPYNDSESQGTFFVDVPDLSSSASTLIIQRGVGTSTNGVSAFGASVNIVSKNPEEKFYVQSDNSYGSFNTYKYSLELGSGMLFNNTVSLMGRYTKIHSDGYIDRAFSDLDSYNFTARYHKGNTSLRLLAFGGIEKTYQAWNGIDKSRWEVNPRFNYSGAIYSSDWSEIEGFYSNETDNYRQNHYQFLLEQDLSERWRIENTLHYTKGKGYYENYKQGESLATYEQGSSDKYSDFVRKKWLDNDFYGMVSNLYGTTGSLDLNFGLVLNQYAGAHYGEAKDYLLSDSRFEPYYRNRSIKSEISGFGKAILHLGRFDLFGDLQLRRISYDMKILDPGDAEGANLNLDWTFFNPKAGLNYGLESGKLFLSYAKASREPNRDDLIANPVVKHETLHDFEAGWEHRASSQFQWALNLYYMHYVDQLVLSGQINSIGEPIRTNSGKSFRRGIELSTVAKVSKNWELSSNLTLSQNRNIDFKSVAQDQLVSHGDTPISFSPEFMGNLSLRYSPASSFSAALVNQYVGAQYLDNTQNKDLKTQGYFLSDLSFRYKLPIGKHKVDLKLLVNNLFNKKYVNNGYVWDQTPYYFAQAGTNFLFGLSYRFD